MEVGHSDSSAPAAAPNADAVSLQDMKRQFIIYIMKHCFITYVVVAVVVNIILYAAEWWSRAFRDRISIPLTAIAIFINYAAFVVRLWSVGNRPRGYDEVAGSQIQANDRKRQAARKKE